MRTKAILIGLVLSLFILNTAFSSAIVITSVESSNFFPGEEKRITIVVKNIFDDDAEEVSLSLDFSNVPFTPVGSSEDSVDDIRDGKNADFLFKVRAANDIKPGDYEIPYEITYEIEGDRRERHGTIGLRVDADTELEFSSSGETAVVGSEGKITLKIVNKGFADAKFLSVRIFPDGYTLLSDNDVYIGTVDSDDFETASFNVIFNKEKANLKAIVEYKDFNNNKIIENINLPITVYTREKAIELGIIKKNNTFLYLTVIVIILILWFAYRKINKARRLKQSRLRRQEG